MHVKATLIYHYTPFVIDLKKLTGANVADNAEKLDVSYIAG